MTIRRWDVVVVAIACTTLGLLTGWAADRREHQTSEDDPATADAQDPAHPHTVAFSPESLTNLGVQVEPASVREFVREKRVAAIVESTAFTERPVRALVGGRVLEVMVEPGRVVSPGQPLARMLRAPIALPQLDVTSDLLRPAHTEIHESIRSLRRARSEEAIALAERDRLGSLHSEDLPLVPSQRLVEVDYEIQRAQVGYQLAEHELERHGVSGQQIDAIANGEHLVAFGADSVRRALVHHGLWPENAARLTAALPESTAGEPLAIATIGELGAKGLLTNEVVDWLASTPGAAKHFVTIGSLLLRGHALADVQHMAEDGALESEVVVRAPDGAVDWDVADIAVRVGATVSPTFTLLTLRDPRQLRLRIHPLGGEVEIVEQAAARSLACRATASLPGTGPTLEGLRVDYVSAEATHGSHAWARFDNQSILADDADGAFRTWQVREGTAYEFRVPIDTIEDAIVLPRGAVLEDGPERIVLVPSGETFIEVPVIVAYENAEVTVLRVADQTKLTADSAVVVEGAFEVVLALHADEQAGGHVHQH